MCGPAAPSQSVGPARRAAPPPARPPGGPSAASLPTPAPSSERGSADGPAGGRRHRSLRLDARRRDGRAGGEPARRDRHARRHRLRGRDDRRAQRLLRRIMGRGQGPHPVRRHGQPRHPHRRRRADAGVHGRARPPGTGTPGSRTTSGRGTSIVLDGNCGLLARKCSEGSDQATWLRDDLAASDAGCTVALLHQPRFSSGQHGYDRGVRPLWDALYAGAPTWCSTATTTTTSVSARRIPVAQRTRHAGSWRSSPGTAGPRSRRSRTPGRTAGKDRRHLRGAGADALSRLVVIALRRRRRFDPRQGVGDLPLSGRVRPRPGRPRRRPCRRTRRPRSGQLCVPRPLEQVLGECAEPGARSPDAWSGWREERS